MDFAALPQLLTGTTPSNIVLSTGDFNYDFRAAGRLVVGHTINDCFQIEGVYMGVTQSDNTLAVRDHTPNAVGTTGDLFSPFSGFGGSPTIGLDYNYFAQIRYTSSLQSVELNVRRKMPLPPERMAASFLFGVRYIGMPESFQYDTASASPLAAGSLVSTHVATTNEMIGPQIGGLFEFYIDNRWWINCEVKAAVMNNRSRQATDFSNTVNGFTTHGFFSRQEDHTAFAGQLELTFVYRWSTHFDTRFGYQALWLEEMALAPNNFNADVAFLTQGPAQLDHSGGVVYHGPFAGVTLAW